MSFKKLSALLLALSLALGLCSCGGVQTFSGGVGAGKGGGSQASPGQEGYYTQTWHGDVEYSDMEYIHYDLEQLDEYLESIYDMAENGGTEDQFYEADYQLFDQLYIDRTPARDVPFHGGSPLCIIVLRA